MRIKYMLHYSLLTVRLHRFAAAGQLDGRSEPAELDRGRVVRGGQQGARRPHVPVDDVVLVAVAQRLQNLAHVVAGGGEAKSRRYSDYLPRGHLKFLDGVRARLIGGGCKPLTC